MPVETARRTLNRAFVRAAERGVCNDVDLDARGPYVNSDDVKRLLIAHTDAWNGHDIERLMSLFADDCVFDASGGPESHGRTFVGRDQVTSAFTDVLDSMPDAELGRWPPPRDLR